MKKKIFITQQLPGGNLNQLSDYDLEVWPKRTISRKELLQKVKGCSGIISLLTERIDGEVMEAAGENLRVIGNYAVGFDNVDVGEATRRGVVVVNTPGILTEAVAEQVIALALVISRRIVEGDHFVREGRYKGWEPDLLIGSSLRGKVMGVVGLGRIGRWVGRLARGVGMQVIYYSHSRDEEYELECEAKYKTLDQLLKTADVVSLNVPLSKETERMVGAKQLSLMKKTGVLINTARGKIVDQEALIKVLQQRRIAGAGLDVYEDEARVDVRLRELNNVVLTPHTASATVEARWLMSRMVINGVREVLAGKCPDNIVNKEVWEKRKVKRTNN